MPSTFAASLVLAPVLFFFVSGPAEAQDPATCPMHDAHMHASDVDRRGDTVMGFEHTKTTHHFRLTTDGGEIDVAANDPNDLASREAIRSHLKTVAREFSAGDFSMPLAVHGQTPPGVEAMKGGAGAIRYEYEETESGARVRIVSADAALREAVHEFLRFQIEDHRTGDSVEVRQGM